MSVYVNDPALNITIVDDDGGETASLTALAAVESGIDPQDRRFWLRRIVRRVCLAEHLGLDPRLLNFGREPAGRPFILGHEDIGFSVAQAGGLTVIAICESPVGVDIELPARLPAREAWHPFLSPVEAAILADLAEADARALALRLWVRKEAFFKAVGTGFLIDPRTVTLLDGDSAWGVRVQDASLADGNMCAVAVSGMGDVTLSCRHVSLWHLLQVSNAIR